MNSREKGKRGEREAAKALTRIFGTAAKRSQQHCGADGDADLSPDSLPGFHVEVKYHGKITSYALLEEFEAVLTQHRGTDALAFLDQATDDCKAQRRPVAMIRHNRKKRWAFLLWEDDFKELYLAYQASKTGTEGQAEPQA